MAKSQQFPFEKGRVTYNCRSFINGMSWKKKTNREANNNQKAYFFCHLIPAEYFTDTHDWLVIGFLCVVNERRQVGGILNESEEECKRKRDVLSAEINSWLVRCY